jgi:hypothetical protein
MTTKYLDDDLQSSRITVEAPTVVGLIRSAEYCWKKHGGNRVAYSFGAPYQTVAANAYSGYHAPYADVAAYDTEYTFNHVVIGAAAAVDHVFSTPWRLSVGFSKIAAWIPLMRIGSNLAPVLRVHGGTMLATDPLSASVSNVAACPNYAIKLAHWFKGQSDYAMLGFATATLTPTIGASRLIALTPKVTIPKPYSNYSDTISPPVRLWLAGMTIWEVP